MTLATNPDLSGLNNETNEFENSKESVIQNLFKNEKLKKFYSQNPQLLSDILNDEGVQEYLKEHPKDSETLFSKIMINFLSKKNANNAKRKK